jgi:hypothetical protein
VRPTSGGTDELDDRCLGAVVSFLLVEEHGATDGRALGVATGQGMLVEIDFAAVRGFDESVAPPGVEAGDSSALASHMGFLTSSLPSHMVLEPATDGEKGVSESHEHVFVGMVATVVPVDDDLSAGHDEVDAYGIQSPGSAAAVGLGQDHVASCDAAGKTLQLIDVGEHRLAHGVIGRHVEERHLRLRLHGICTTDGRKEERGAVTPELSG